MESQARSYYCSMKFRFLKIDLQSNTIYTCDAAKPQRVDLAWLEKNPGQLFNTEATVNDRKLMLQNIRNENCEQNCWPAEDRGAISPRLLRGGNILAQTELYQQPEEIDLTVNGECNLTCSYCCKEFSSSWRKDIVSNGTYKLTKVDDRYTVTSKDLVLEKLSQQQIKKSKNYYMLLNEMRLFAPTLKKLYVTGGEPLLDNQLVDILLDIPFNETVEFNLFSGLGLSMSRFEKLLDKLQKLSDKYVNFRLKISAESIGKFYEFNRYGNTWEDFAQKVQLLIDRKIKFIFHSTISNLTLFSFYNFRQKFSDINFTLDHVYCPSMLAPHVLDPDSKKLIIEQLNLLPQEQRIPLLKSMASNPTELERSDLREFLLEFTRRRPDLSLSIFPTTFLKWLDLHVV